MNCSANLERSGFEMTRVSIKDTSIKMTIPIITFSRILKKVLKNSKKMAMADIPIIHGVDDMAKVSLKTIPAPMEFPAWNEAATIKSPTPMTMATHLPYVR